MQFECPAEESRSRFSITSQMDEDLWEDPSNADTRP